MLEDERQSHNLRRARLYAPTLLTVHLLVAALSLSAPHSEAERRFRHGLLTLHGGMIPVVVLLGVIAYLPGRAGRRFMGEVFAFSYCIWGALVALNAQRLHTAINAYIIVLLAVAVGVRLRIWPALASMGCALGMLLVGLVYVQPDAGIRFATTITAIGFTIVAAGISRAAFAGHVREVRARLLVQRINDELEERVAEQVQEIVARAKDIEALNEQLAQKVRERSRELTVALSRLAEAHAVAPPLPAGTVLGDRVVIERPIGVGGMGTVYRAHDRVSDRAVAVKLVQAATAQELDGLLRFLREATAAASVRHPAIVRSLHVDVSEDGRLFQILELVEGETLEQRLEGGAMPLAHALRLGAVLADALAAAHGAGIVHRDVKPSNVMLTTAAPGMKLLDFGVAKLASALPVGTTHTGAIVGTPEYMAPEQFATPESADERIDLYSVGLLLYRAIAGRRPFEARTLTAWMRAHAELTPAPLDPSVPADIAMLIFTCLEKDPAARPSAHDLALALGIHADAMVAPSLVDLENARGEVPTRRSRPPAELAPTLAAGSDARVQKP